MSDDDQIGYLLTRREALTLLGSAGLIFVSGCKAADGSVRAASARGPTGCVVRPEQTEGPYFVDEMLKRSDIRSDPTSGELKAGLPLALGFNVMEIAGQTCKPLAGAVVDVWHCDAQGYYSDVQDPRFNTKGQKYLRGYQLTDAAGHAQFATIYPGWYPGRAVHIHFMIRSPAGVKPGYQFTSQLYFDDALSEKIQAQPPYAKDGRGRLRNAGDGIFRDGGAQLLLAVTPQAEGYKGVFDVSLQTG